MVAETQTARYFPYVGAPGWLSTLRDLFRRSVPQRLDSDWLTATDRFSFSQSNARQLLSMLQKIGWINADGTILEAGRSLRATGAPYEEAMSEILQRFYGDLIEQIESSTTFAADDVDQFFVATSEMGRSGRQQMIAIFRWFLREAGKNSIEERVWAKRMRGESTPAREIRKSTPRSKAALKVIAKTPRRARPTVEGQNDAEPTADARLGAIASVLRINIDGSWTDAQIESAMRSLDRLLKGAD